MTTVLRTQIAGVEGRNVGNAASWVDMLSTPKRVGPATQTESSATAEVCPRRPLKDKAL